MKVGELMKELNKMPLNLNVGIREHDNMEYEISGWPIGVSHLIKSNFKKELDPMSDTDVIDSQPDEWVVIYC